MRFTIRHQTVYTYSPPVTLGPHTLRFQPRSDGGQLLKSFELLVTPEPVMLTHTLDAEGNTVARAWFSGLHQRLSVTGRATVETARANPFDYLLDAGATSLPPKYSAPLRQRLAPALERGAPRDENDGAASDEVRTFAAGLSTKVGDVLAFLDCLNRELHAQFEVIHRGEGSPLAPAETFRARRGACRDLAVLFIDACRAMGLAARFVSGYQQCESTPAAPQRPGCLVTESHAPAPPDLHAWAEVFIPGGGWRGYDPTLGLAVSDRHVAVAAAADPADAAPVTGAHGVATATMATELSIGSAAIQSSAPGQQHQLQQQ